MKCNNCGFEIEEGFFCPVCGTKLDTKSDVLAEALTAENPLLSDGAPIVDVEKYILENFNETTTVKAIKKYRDLTGEGLKESTDAVKRIFTSSSKDNTQNKGSRERFEGEEVYLSYSNEETGDKSILTRKELYVLTVRETEKRECRYDIEKIGEMTTFLFGTILRFKYQGSLIKRSAYVGGNAHEWIKTILEIQTGKI